MPVWLDGSPASILFSLFFIGALAYAISYWKHERRRQGLPYPPGPTPRFLIGNALDLPTKREPQAFAEWSKKYNSGILHAGALGLNMVIVNDLDIANELFEKRSRIYNDRPDLAILKLLGWQATNVGLMRYGDDWRRHRKACWEYFRPEAAKQYHSLQVSTTRTFLRRLLATPNDFSDHIKALSVSTTLMMMYGYDAKKDDPIVHAADEVAVGAASLVGQGGGLVNVIPALRHIPPWFPFAVTQKKAAHLRDLTDQLRSQPAEHVRKGLKDGTALPSLVTDLFEKQRAGEMDADTERIAMNIGWTVYAAASDTSISAGLTLMHKLATHPEVVERAHEELDRVVGIGRLPGFDDRPELPYIDAIYREVLRYCPPIPGSIVHSLSEDDVYEGYFLPQGSLVIGNIWAMTRDETKYPDPEAFKPERFLTPDGKLNDDDRILAYGFGRRTCVGKHVASASMWLMIAYLLTAFDIGKAKDESGYDIPVDDQYLDLGAVTHKGPFKCSITPRSERHRKLILEDF